MKSVDLRPLLSTGRGRRLFITSSVAGAFWSALIVCNAFLIAEIIVGIIAHKSGVPRLIIFLAFLWLARAIFQSHFDYWCSVQAIRIKGGLRTETTSSIGNYSTSSPATLSNVLTKGLNALDVYIGRFIPQLIFATLTPLVVIITLFIQDTISGFIAIFTLPLIPFFGALIGRFSSESVMKKWRTLGTLSSYFEDSLRGFVTLKIFGRSKSQSKRIAAMGDMYADETMKVLRISFLSAFALELIATLSVAVIAVSIGLRLVSGSMEFKTALVVLILAPEVYFPVRNAASLFHSSQDGTQALHELEEVRHYPDKEVVPVPLLMSQLDIDSLSWPSSQIYQSTIPASLINRGEMLFIVGDSGIGKTTFSNNLLGFTFDAPIVIHAKSASLILEPSMQNAWQKIVGWIPQNPQLATGTLRDQFRLLNPSISDARIGEALAGVGLSIPDLPSGLDTPIGKGGESSHSASGGQIRRIAVARALIRNPLLIIADEPTADLDAESAHIVMQALRAAQGNGAMVICISHDLEFALDEDSICSLERSRV